MSILLLSTIFFAGCTLGLWYALHRIYTGQLSAFQLGEINARTIRQTNELSETATKAAAGLAAGLLVRGGPEVPQRFFETMVVCTKPERMQRAMQMAEERKS